MRAADARGGPLAGDETTLFTTAIIKALAQSSASAPKRNDGFFG
jgi:hypothetical protein